jgi:hypothetical protein
VRASELSSNIIGAGSDRPNSCSWWRRTRRRRWSPELGRSCRLRNISPFQDAPHPFVNPVCSEYTGTQRGHAANAVARPRRRRAPPRPTTASCSTARSSARSPPRTPRRGGSCSSHGPGRKRLGVPRVHLNPQGPLHNMGSRQVFGVMPSSHRSCSTLLSPPADRASLSQAPTAEEAREWLGMLGALVTARR